MALSEIKVNNETVAVVEQSLEPNKNLIASNIVYDNVIHKVDCLDDDSDADLNVRDSSGNIILQLKDGELKTSEFDTRRAVIELDDESDADLNVGDSSGNVILQLKKGHIRTKNFNSNNIDNSIICKSDNSSADLNISDENGEVICQFSEGHIRTQNFNSNSIIGISDKNRTDYSTDKLTTFGDSLTHFAGWQPSLIEMLGISTYTNCGYGGTTVAENIHHSSSFYPMYTDTRINQIPTNTTLLTFMGGVNDWNVNIPLGDKLKSNEDEYTFYGALNIVAEKLLQRIPTARIIWMGTTWASSEYHLDPEWQEEHGISWSEVGWINGLGLEIANYREALKNVAEWWGFPYINVGGQMGVNELNREYFFDSSEAPSKYHHPNELGYKRMTQIIYCGLKNL